MTRKPRRAASERGQATAMVVMLMLATLVFSMFAIDFGAVWLEHTRQSDMLQQSEASCMEPAVALKVKNSDAPGRDMCAALAQDLRASGFTGSIEAYYYEATPADPLYDSRTRVYVFGASVASESTSTFASLAGIAPPAVRSRAWAHAQFYSSERAWRPATTSNGRLRVEAGAPVSSGSWSPVNNPNETIMPGVGSALDKAAREMAH